MLEEFTDDWVVSLDKEDVYRLSLLLFRVLKQKFLQQVYPASKIIGRYVKRYEDKLCFILIIHSVFFIHIGTIKQLKGGV